jgi:hypothetical protein
LQLKSKLHDLELVLRAMWYPVENRWGGVCLRPDPSDVSATVFPAAC